MIGFKRRPAVYAARVSVPDSGGTRGGKGTMVSDKCLFCISNPRRRRREGIGIAKKKSRPTDYPTGVT